MACRQPHLDQDEVYRLLYDINDNEGLNESCDRLDDNDQISSEDEEDVVEEDYEDDVDSVYDIDDMNELDDSDTDNSATETSTDEDIDSYEAKNHVHYMPARNIWAWQSYVMLAKSKMQRAKKVNNCRFVLCFELLRQFLYQFFSTQLLIMLKLRSLKSVMKMTSLWHHKRKCLKLWCAFWLLFCIQNWIVKKNIKIAFNHCPLYYGVKFDPTWPSTVSNKIELAFSGLKIL